MKTLTETELELLIAALYYGIEDFDDLIMSGDDVTRLMGAAKLQRWADYAAQAQVTDRFHLDQVIADARETLRCWREEVRSS